MRLVVLLTHEGIKDLRLPIIVENWERLIGVNQYKEQFSENERRKINAYHRKIRKWYLECGFPQELELTGADYALLQKAVAFFASG